MAPLYYRGAAAAILVYDISNMQSFVTLKDWVAELQSQAPREMVLAIAGNKSDLDGSREVETRYVRSSAFWFCSFAISLLPSLASAVRCARFSFENSFLVFVSCGPRAVLLRNMQMMWEPAS